jgi:Sulfotransferase domain
MTTTPNFFIIGAPKCGTTAMCEYLHTHPNIFMSDSKEPFFVAIHSAPSHRATMADYLSRFANANSQQVIVGEHSTPYIQSAQALEKIRLLSPDARLLVMLRRPTDLVYAYHAQMRKQGIEVEWDFEKAWNLQPMRAMGKSIPRGINPHLLDYKWIGSVGSQVDSLLQIFPRSQVHFIRFEDFAKDAGTEYRRVLEFLGIPDDGKVEFPKANENTHFKSARIAKLPRYLRSRVGVNRIKAIKDALGIRQFGITPAIDKFNKEVRPRPPLRPELRRHLDELFTPEVVLLEKLLGWDLSKWRVDEIQETPPNAAAFDRGYSTPAAYQRPAGGGRSGSD